MKKISFDSIAALKAFAGQPAAVGQPIVVDQSAIDTFGDVVHDRQWIHVDPVRAAAESPFGTTIAHGLLTLSLITGWYHQLFEFPGRKLALNYGFDKVRFPAPVPSGSALVGSFRLARVDDLGPDEARCLWEVDVRVAGAERPAMVAEWLMQLRY
ncbi:MULTISPECIES: MaoC family dehydratase [Bordetella]|uniref:MaoC-like domain-containing protein n=4 Tax=Bordetella TaxID=517 RepID=K0M920_BORPB|nr:MULTISPECIES: MaoC family dehydratase [Bordetella]KAK64618.1 putative enoyl-CoA hydratase 1 [Bordetella bronchiseptica 980-2]SHS96294.1 ZbpA protein [Mycobacteroides abscessus subsp. abscessus]AMG88554.1 MaoC family dehydratase [Bordetella bronchiseptica]AWP75660.1 oxidoreductase [Bordetella bronchiseptica]AWP80488.1 oxidoreductase [Bordetella bronchiseptica]